MPSLIAYHSKPAIKRKYLARVRAHRKADQLIKGTYWQNGKGCAVGCTVHSGNHQAYEDELGIPRALARLEDGIFEGLPNGQALKWPERFLSAITPGADLSGVVEKFLHWLLVDPKDGAIKFAKSEKSKAAIQRVGDLYARKIKGETISEADWQAARSAADTARSAAYAADAAAYDADAAAYAYAAAAAYAAYATAYAYAAAAAAYAAANAAAYAADAAAAAKSQARMRQADKLVELLKECKPTKKPTT